MYFDLLEDRLTAREAIGRQHVPLHGSRIGPALGPRLVRADTGLFVPKPSSQVLMVGAWPAALLGLPAGVHRSPGTNIPVVAQLVTRA